jgi:Cof subfamily protein (haloacid dehalogenase superfamily)
MTTKNFNPGDVKAIAFDLDGTLLNEEKALSERTLRAVAACKNRGIRIILATGRSADSGEKYRRQLDLEGPQVYYNGAEVVDMPSGRVMYARLLETGPALFCARLARERGIYYQVYFPAGAGGAGEVLMTDDSSGKESEYYETYTGITPVKGNLEAALSRPGLPGLIKVMFVTGEENHPAIQSQLKETYGDAINVIRSSPQFLEVLAGGVSKGTGLVQALNHLKLSGENTLVFGDEDNDLSMFAAAAWSAAPANAKPRIQEAASFHIPANTEEGVAAFLEERFGLQAR